MKIISDTNLSSSTSQSFNGLACTCCNDVVSAEMDDNGDFYAIMTSLSGCSQEEGHLQKSLFSTNYLPPCFFDVQTNYKFLEGSINMQGISPSVHTVRANALALNHSYVFTYDGKTLKAWNKINGNLFDSIIVNPSYIGGKYRFHEGIDVDECNTVYVGGTNIIHVFIFNGSTFVTQPSISTNITNNVRDIKLNNAANKIYVCGPGFVTETIASILCYTGQISTSINVDSCKGNFCVKATGGIPPFHYQWSNGSNDSCIMDAPPGVYTVTITENSCFLNNHIDTITINSLLITVTPSHPVICFGDAITLTASSTLAGTIFNWSNGTIGNAITISPLSNTSYSVIGNNNRCSDTASVSVTVHPSYQDTLNPVICQGNYYSIGSHTYTATGSYVDTLTTSSGCDSIITTNLTVNPPPYTIKNPVMCQGNSYSVGNHTYSSTGTFTDTLSTSSGCDSIITTNLIVNPVYDTAIRPVICQGQSFEVGNHIYTVTNTYIDSLSTIKGCDSIITTYLTVNSINSTISTPAQICEGESVVLFATGGTSYYWIPPYGLSSQTSSSTLASPDSTTTYYVTITDDPCYKVDSVKVTVTECPAIYFPNSFTPDGDGINDLFMAKGIMIESFSMIIFDRWGEEIFTSNNIMQGWDGTYKGEKCSNAVFSYIADIVFTNGEKVNKIGSITLLR